MRKELCPKGYDQYSPLLLTVFLRGNCGHTIEWLNQRSNLPRSQVSVQINIIDIQGGAC